MFAELQRRRVIRVVVLYAIPGWFVIEVASTVLPGLKLPGWTSTLVIVLVAPGFPVAVIMAWAPDRGRGDRAWLETDSDLDCPRGDSRFEALLDRIH